MTPRQPHRPTQRRLLAGAGALAVCVVASGCSGSPVTTSVSQHGATLVTWTDSTAPTCDAKVVTGLVTQDPRGCYQLDGFPVAFPAGTSFADDRGHNLRLPDGAVLAPGSIVSGPVCRSGPVPEWAGYDCGTTVLDSTRGFVGGISVQPAQP